jgi:hypothetical protein
MHLAVPRTGLHVPTWVIRPGSRRKQNLRKAEIWRLL